MATSVGGIDGRRTRAGDGGWLLRWTAAIALLATVGVIMLAVGASERPAVDTPALSAPGVAASVIIHPSPWFLTVDHRTRMPVSPRYRGELSRRREVPSDRSSIYAPSPGIAPRPGSANAS
jgi:hypothetical protein